MITACIVLLYISYSIPVICLLLRGRSTIGHGPFWLGRFGFVCNIVLLSWTFFTLIMYSFPYARPTTAGNMNYVSVVYAVVALLMPVDYLVRGRKSFRGASERKPLDGDAARTISVRGGGKTDGEDAAQEWEAGRAEGSTSASSI